MQISPNASHLNRGLRQSAATVCGNGGLDALVDCRVLGSRITTSITTARKNPGAPATKNATRQPQCAATYPPKANPRNPPAEALTSKVDMALVRRAGSNKSATSAVLAGCEPASPTLTPMRATSNCRKFPTMP